jgi:alpha-N-acetylglucosaminidase
MSFMLFSNQQEVLDRVLDWLKPGGRLVFFQTMFRKRSRLMEFIKPKLKYFTTVDFGSVTYDEEFYRFLGRNRLPVVKDHFIKKEWFQGEYRMIAVQPPPCKETERRSDGYFPQPAFSRRK